MRKNTWCERREIFGYCLHGSLVLSLCSQDYTSVLACKYLLDLLFFHILKIVLFLRVECNQTASEQENVFLKIFRNSLKKFIVSEW